MRASIPAARIPILILKCCAVCIVLGSLVGGIGVGLGMEFAGALGVTPYKESPSLRNLLMSPAMAFFALPMTIPFGSFCGVAASVVVLNISYWDVHPIGKTKLALIGAATGFLFGICCPMFLVALGFQRDRYFVAIIGALGAVAGAIAGAVIGLIAWKEFQRNATGG